MITGISYLKQLISAPHRVEILLRVMYIPDMDVHLSRSASFMRRMDNEMRKRMTIPFRSHISKSQTWECVYMNDGEMLDPLRSVQFYCKFLFFVVTSTGRQSVIIDKNQEKHMAGKSTPS